MTRGRMTSRPGTPQQSTFPSPKEEATRICPRCDKRKAVTEFAPDPTKASGKKSHCRSCDAERARLYYGVNREGVVARVKHRRGCLRERSGRVPRTVSTKETALTRFPPAYSTRLLAARCKRRFAGQQALVQKARRLHN
jgi:hypothetical protein